MKRAAASAPGRCGILGNPSDIYGGVVFSSSIPRRNSCLIEEWEADDLPDDPTLWNAATARFPIDRTVRVTWRSEVPRSSGLAGSTALLAATLAAVFAFQGRDRGSPVEFAELVRDIERNEAGVVCGYQDAMMVVHGGLNLMDFEGKHPARPGPHPQITPVDSPLPFLLVTTGVTRLSGSVHGPMVERWLAGERPVTDAMERLPELAVSGTAAMKAGDLKTVAAAMNENQRLIADLGGSGSEIDSLVAACLGEGALAAKLAGAGMGGTVIALTEVPAQLQSRLKALGYDKFIPVSVEPGLRLEEPSW